MQRIDTRDVIGGALLILLGTGTAVHSMSSFNMGTLARMGPGYFPAAVSIVLALFGLAILVPALLRAGNAPVIEWRPLLWICAAVLSFALLVLPFGMGPAIVVLTLLCSRADSKLSLRASLLLGIALAVGAALIFRVGLGMILPVFAWPW